MREERDRRAVLLWRRGLKYPEIVRQLRKDGFERSSLATVKRAIKAARDPIAAEARALELARQKAEAREDVTARHFLLGAQVGLSLGYEQYAEKPAYSLRLAPVTIRALHDKGPRAQRRALEMWDEERRRL